MLEITDSFILMLALLLFFDSEGLLPAFLMAAMLHETGHVLALWATGGELRRLRVTAVGGRMDCVLPESRARRFAVHLAGAAMNFAAFALFRALGCYLIAGANLVLGGFNLLPVCPLDGYACIDALLEGGFARTRRVLSVGFASVLLAFGTYMFWAGKGVSLAVIGAFLVLNSGKNLQKI